MNISDDSLEKIKSSKSICVLTGAGISAESGVPTFRGEEGHWTKMRPEEMASRPGFLSNPDYVWGWYNYRREIISNVSPNPGHLALAKIESKISKFTLVTQNVDGLHQKAGSKNIFELHGNIQNNFCLVCGKEIGPLQVSRDQKVQNCKDCGGYIRPGVVWFGESLPQRAINASIESASQCDLCLAIGTSSIVYPAASIPQIAVERGAYVIEINISETPLTSFVSEFIKGPSGEVLPKILNKLGWDN